MLCDSVYSILTDEMYTTYMLVNAAMSIQLLLAYLYIIGLWALHYNCGWKPGMH
jgi:hypothetical protein